MQAFPHLVYDCLQWQLYIRWEGHGNKASYFKGAVISR